MDEPVRPKQGVERRRAPRFNISLPVTFTAEGSSRTYAATVDNISLGGLLLLTDAPLRDGSRIVIHLPIAPDMTMAVEASLVRRTDVGEFGVAFVALRDDELDRIADFVEQRASSR